MRRDKGHAMLGAGHPGNGNTIAVDLENGVG
jgi:hypothetical protein